jgi:hypothetical protein
MFCTPSGNKSRILTWTHHSHPPQADVRSTQLISNSPWIILILPLRVFFRTLKLYPCHIPVTSPRIEEASLTCPPLPTVTMKLRRFAVRVVHTPFFSPPLQATFKYYTLKYWSEVGFRPWYPRSSLQSFRGFPWQQFVEGDKLCLGYGEYSLTHQCHL